MDQKKFKRNDSGAVLLETLLTLPVYLVMLSGLFWMGELCLTRLTMTHGERLRLWEKGNWNDHGEKESAKIFWFLSPQTGSRPQVVTGYSGFTHTFKPESAAEKWGSIVSGHATVKTRRSQWSWGIASFFRNFLEKKNKEVPGDKEMEMLARSDGGATPKSLDSMALFRSGTERKDDLDSNGKSDWSNKITWGAIYEGEWGDFITPKFVAAAIKLDKYTRNHFYLDWSE